MWVTRLHVLVTWGTHMDWAPCRSESACRAASLNQHVITNAFFTYQITIQLFLRVYCLFFSVDTFTTWIHATGGATPGHEALKIPLALFECDALSCQVRVIHGGHEVSAGDSHKICSPGRHQQMSSQQFLLNSLPESAFLSFSEWAFMSKSVHEKRSGKHLLEPSRTVDFIGRASRVQQII